MLNAQLEVKARFHITNPAANVIKIDKSESEPVSAHMPVIRLADGSGLELLIDSPAHLSESTQYCNVISSENNDVVVIINCFISLDEDLTLFSNEHGVFSRDFSNPKSQNERVPVSLYVCGKDGELNHLLNYAVEDTEQTGDITTDEGIKQICMALCKLFLADAIDSEISCEVITNASTL